LTNFVRRSSFTPATVSVLFQLRLCVSFESNATCWHDKLRLVENGCTCAKSGSTKVTCTTCNKKKDLHETFRSLISNAVSYLCADKTVSIKLYSLTCTYSMTKYVRKFSLWNSKKLLRKQQKKSYGDTFCRTR